MLEHGGDVDQAIAGLLHDSIEDNDLVSLELLEQHFGVAVARMVRDCTDTLPTDTAEKKSPWRERKERYVAQLRECDSRSLLVAVCDKCHNLANLVADLRAEGAETLARFSAGPHEQLWYFESVLEVAAGRVPEKLERELTERLGEFRSLVTQ